MEHDACLFELLVFSNNFFTPDTSFPPPVPASDDVAFNNHPIAPAVLEADLCVTTPEDDVSRFGQDGDDEECYEESHNGIALEFEGKEALGSFSSGGEMEVSAPSTSADAEDADLNGKPIVDGAGIPSGVEILETVDEENHEHMHVSTPDDEEASGAPAQDPGAGASENEDSFFRQSGDPIVQDGGTSVGQVAPALDDEGGADAGARLDITSPSTSARAPSVPASPFIDFVREHRALQEGGVPQMGSESSGSCGPDSHSSPVSASGMDVSPRRGGELHLIGGDAIPEQEETPSQTWCIEPDLCLEDRVGSSSQDVSVEVAVDGGAGATDSSAVESKTGEATSATAQPESEPGVQCGVMEEDQPE
uniref:Uncharacterized protein n=2 Tax=Hemiselmis tepida TaxID=464990 RepID=A0A7S0WBR8_9CRYP